MGGAKKERIRRYPFSMKRVYLSMTTTVLSAILAFLLLATQPIFLLFYAGLTAVLAAGIFVLKIRFLMRILDTEDESPPEGEQVSTKWGSLILLFFISLAMVAFPFLLAGILDPSSWFTILISLSSGVSISEVSLYIYTERMVG